MYYMYYRMEAMKNEGFEMAKTLNVRISDEIERRLEDLAKKTKRPKSFYIKDMLEKYLDEYEEAYLALDEDLREKCPVLHEQGGKEAP